MKKPIGRPISGRQPYKVMCHPKIINDVRKYAKEKSEEQLKKDKE